MNISLRRSLFCSIAIAAMALCGAHSADAQTHVLGGGSTLAVLDYWTEFGDDGIATAFTYCSVGSGAGTNAFVGNLDAPLNADTVHCPASIVTGKSVDYGASDAYISDANITAFNANAHAGPLIQIPMFGTPVTMALSTHLGTTTLTSDGQITLTDAQLCGIYAGAITDWHTIKSTIPVNTPINVAYRSDSSGTTFLLTDHLKAACPGAAPGAFSQAQLAAMPTNNLASLFGMPANFTPGIGSSGVQSIVVNAANVISYLSPDYTHVSVNGANAGFPFVAQVTNSHNSTNYLPTVANTSTALGPIAAPTGADEANPDKWVPVLVNPALSDPATGYPISGFTYWVLPTCYAASATTTKVVSFLQDHLNEDGAHTATIDDIAAAGFVSLPGVSDSAAPTAGSYAAKVNSVFLAAAGDLQSLQIATVGVGSNNLTRCNVTGVVGR